MSLHPHTAVIALSTLLTACSPVVYDPYVGSRGDRDGDGWADFEEEDLDTDPANPFNWDFGGEKWPDFTDEAAAGTVGAEFGWGFGQTYPDFLARDQYGNNVPFYTFYGYAVVLDFSAGWCPPCRVVAEGSEEVWVEHRLDGVLIVHMMIDDDIDDVNSTIEDTFTRRWAREYNADFPVLEQVEGAAAGYARLLQSGVGTGAIPLFVVLDHDFEIVDSFEGSDQAVAAEELAIQLARQRDR